MATRQEIGRRFSGVDALVVDIGHSSVRAGCAGQSSPTCIWPAVIGTGDGHDVFPVVASKNSAFPYVQLLRHLYMDKDGKPELSISKLSYIRALKGVLGDPRVDDRRLLNAVKAYPNMFGDIRETIKLGVIGAPRDCWDEFNCNSMAAVHRKSITRIDEIQFDRVVKGLTRFNTVSSGIGEQNPSRPILIVEGNQSSMSIRQEQTELIMEDLQSRGVYFGNGCELATHVFGMPNAFVFDVGASTTSLGLVLEEEICTFREHLVGGDHIDALLYLLLREAGENALHGVFYHPSYSLGTQLWDNLYEEQLPVSLATRIWRKKYSLKEFWLHDMIKALKESAIHAALYPVFSRTPLDEAKYRDIMRAAAPRWQPAGRRSFHDPKLPDGTVMNLSTSEPTTPQSMGNKHQTWILQSSQRSTPPASGASPRSVVASGNNPFKNVSADSLLATAAELIFDPCSVSARLPVDVGDFKGLFKSFESMIHESEINRPDIFRNLIVIGGCANMPGFSDRVSNDFIVHQKDCSPPIQGQEYRVLQPPAKMNRSLVSWQGGSMLASLSSFASSWISIYEYREHGPNICRRKGGWNLAHMEKGS